MEIYRAAKLRTQLKKVKSHIITELEKSVYSNIQMGIGVNKIDYLEYIFVSGLDNLTGKPVLHYEPIDEYLLDNKQYIGNIIDKFFVGDWE